MDFKVKIPWIAVLVVLTVSTSTQATKKEPSCGCSSWSHEKAISPWNTYGRTEFPWLVRVMQNRKFVATGTLISSSWVVTSPFFITSSKGLYIYIDFSLTYKISRWVIKIVIPPALVSHVNRFALLKLNEPIDFNKYNGTVCAVCLAPPKSHHYGKVLMPSYIVPAGYCSFSAYNYRLRSISLDCCFHELRKCEVDGIVCSSDISAEFDNIGCRGTMGAPMVTQFKNRFFMLACMTDLLACERASPCAVFQQMSHNFDFILKHIMEKY